MSATLDDRTVLPNEAAAAVYQQILEDLPPLVGDATMVTHKLRKVARSATLTGPDGHSIQLPPELYHVLRQAVADLAKGCAVTIQPSNAVLTTQQAADLLHISRPTLVKLLEDDKIPYHKHGRHRRILLEDLLTYEEKARKSRRAALAELSYESARDGTDDESNQFITRR
jgi:excisionase family DNA binding protein